MNDLKITVVFDHPDFVVINKPAGISVHKDTAEQGLVTLLKEQLGCEQLFLAHRLDQMTSGLLILAKHVESNRVLSQLFQQRQISKYYIALSNNKPKKKQGLIKGDMAKSRNGSWKLVKANTNPAITQFFSWSIADQYADEFGELIALRFFLLKPHTGKTHQLRVALKSIGSPILGDERYYSDQKVTLTADRGYLHAWRLVFHYQGECYDLQALPESGDLFIHLGFRTFLDSLGHPDQLTWPNL